MKKYFLALVLVAGMQVFCTDLLAEQKVGALGRFRPSLGFVTVSVPPGNTIQEILVRAGDVVKKGKKLIVFRSALSNHAEIEMAELELKEADRMGAKAIEIKKQEVSIARVEKDFARGMLERLLSGGSDTYSAQLKEEREHTARVADSKWALAADEQKRLEENREFTMSKARMKLKAARKKEESLTVAAPADGTIMEILQNPGEGSGGGPVLKMADLQQMDVVAEVFAGDVLKLAAGNKATITSNALPAPLTGKIVSVGRTVAAQSRNAEAVIRLDNSETAARLINMEVNISIGVGK
jgi:HlyD family secretion protein